MKEIVGYLLDRETGVGISGKTVDFTLLSGSPVTSSDTYWQDLSSSVTDSNGRFSGRFELSPGPVNTKVTVSGSEVKIRKHDERAEFGFQWASDISRIARGVQGVVGGFLNGLAVSCPSGHTIRVATGAAIFNGSVFSIENSYMDIAGTANANVALSTRVDLVTLRQYNESASGQNAGKQQVVVTLGSTNNVAPAVPTHADYVDLPIAEVSTAYNASTKTVKTDRRVFTKGTDPTPYPTPLLFKSPAATTANWAGLTTSYLSNIQDIPVTGLDPTKTYDGEIHWQVPLGTGAATDALAYIDLPSGFGYLGGAMTDYVFAFADGGANDDMQVHFTWPIFGLTGAATFTYQLRLKGNYLGSFVYTAPSGYIVLKERR